MYNQQQQSFHTANYRGNVQGHDQYLRADSTQPSSFTNQSMGNSYTSSVGFSNTPVTSQYRGYQRTYQPTGYVQSSYGQNQGMQSSQQSYAGAQGYQSFQNSSQPYGSQMSQESFHTANYRGNQPGHDNYLRADSQQPTNMTSSFSSQSQPQSSMSFGTSSPSMQFQTSSNQYSQQYQSPQQFHTANYQGNQPGHDQYLRADSQQPSQSQYGRSFF